MKKLLIIFPLVLVIILGLVFLFNYYFVVGEGVKAGELNYMVKKGYIFKTFEGKLIQTGLRTSSSNSNVNPTAVQSNEFEFSVTDKGIADTLMLASGKHMQLQYKEYRKALPWRGFSKYVVSKIISIEE